MALIEVGSATFTQQGEHESGDRLVVKPFPRGVLAAVVDGLGHGSEAAAAAETAIATLKSHPEEPLTALLHRCHEVLRSTRGAVISIASFSEARDRMTWGGVGNVEGVLLRAGPAGRRRRESLLLRGGVVGGQLPQVQAAEVPVSRGDVLIFATDGIGESFSDNLSPGDPPQRMADLILARHGKGSDDALVLVARYLGRKRE